MPMTLAGRTVVVTGGGRGIGRACAEAFAVLGANVAVVSRTETEIGTVADSLGARGLAALAIPADVTDYDQCAAVIDRVESVYGGVDVLVNNAGGWRDPGPVATADPRDWAATVEQNLLSAFNMTRAALPAMIGREFGRIVNIGSGTGYRPTPHRSAYGTSKAALAYLTRVVAEEVWSDGIEVNEVVPGPVATALTGEAFVAGRAPAFAGSELVKEPEDVAELVVWVASRPPGGPTGQMFSLARRTLV